MKTMTLSMSSIKLLSLLFNLLEPGKACYNIPSLKKREMISKTIRYLLNCTWIARVESRAGMTKTRRILMRGGDGTSHLSLLLGSSGLVWLGSVRREASWRIGAKDILAVLHTCNITK